MQPKLVAPLDLGNRIYCLTLPGMPPASTGGCGSSRYELMGFSGLRVTNTGALPLFVISRPSDPQTASFLDRLANRSSFATVTLQVYVSSPTGLSLVRTQTFTSVTVDAVAFNDMTALIGFRFTSANDLFPSAPMSTPIPVDATALVEMDVSNARAPVSPRGAFMRMTGLPGASSLRPGWTDLSRMTVIATFEGGAPRVRLEIEKTVDVTSSPLLGAAALPDTTWEFADGMSFSRVRQSYHSANPVRRLVSTLSSQNEAAELELPSCELRFSTFNLSGMVNGSTLFTCP